VHIIDEKDDWYQIKPVKGSSGWISEDYLKFKSKTKPRITKASLSESNIEVAKIAEEEASPKNKETMDREDSTFIFVTGMIELQDQKETGEIAYQLVTSENKIYYLRGAQTILSRFLNYKVKVQGIIEDKVQMASKHPILKVSKIHLIL